MGQKIHPRGFRLGEVFTWSSRWFADKKRYKTLFIEDVKIRNLLTSKLRNAGLESIEIERSINKIKITVNVSRPGVVIGRGGSGLEELKKYIEKFLLDGQRLAKGKGETNRVKLEVAVEPVKEPNLSAQLVAQTVADQLVKRLPHKRVGNQAVERVMAAGAKGVRILLAGRIGGAEISRKEKFQSGTVPLSTIRENVDHALVAALTKSGYVGVKVWICRKQ
ncbi:30S ribosomal protein S3 [Candidatus Gottesmanbacteria bacterium]|nr:30S ribosomal protein S3 [Candidatus Gottesmanbacteria bacterium]